MRLVRRERGWGAEMEKAPAAPSVVTAGVCWVAEEKESERQTSTEE